MAELSENSRRIRQHFMSQVLRDGTAPSVAEIRQELSLPAGEFLRSINELEAALCVAMQDASHAGQQEFQDESLQEPLPPVGEIMYARPFATFKNHYPVSVDGQQKWYAECAAESCAVSPMFPGQLVIVRSVCRETRAPVEVVGRDGILLDYSPRTLRVHLGHPLRDIPRYVLGWCEYNSFFASEDAAVGGVARTQTCVALRVPRSNSQRS